MNGASAPGGPPDRILRVLRQLVTQAGAASITTQDPDDYVPPGTLPLKLPPGLARGGRTGAYPGRGRRAGGPRRGRRDGRGGRRQLGPRLPMALIIMVMGLIVAGMGFQHVTGVSLLPSAGARPPPRKFPVLEASPPARISIPSINLTAPVQDVGLASDGTISPPPPDRPNNAGWYDQSPTPGQYGPAVIVGHVDTRTGPAVFHGLSQVRSGDRVEVDREDGSAAIFEVNSTKRYDKAQFPANQVFGDFNRPGLRLITCGGRWVGGEVGYADNIVVYASLVSARGG